MNEWISVKDRLPENQCICVVWNENRPFQYYISIFLPYFKEFEVYLIGSSRLNDPICFNATYWLKIDSPPSSPNEELLGPSSKGKSDEK